MKPLICFIGILLPILSLNAQTIVERFDDGDFYTHPKWTGDTAAFIINTDNELQLFDQSTVIEPKYLSTAFEATDLLEEEWRIKLHLDFAPSGSNKFRYYLATTNQKLNTDTLLSPGFEAYFIEIGEAGSNDGLKLFYTKEGTDSLIIGGGEGLFAGPFRFTIQVNLDTSNKWKISVEEDDKKESIEIGSALHKPPFRSVSLGVKCFYTSSRRDLFYVDNIYFGPEIKDTIPPKLVSAALVGDQSISLLFSEALDKMKTESQSSFLLEPAGIQPDSLVFFDDSLLLHFTAPFINGAFYKLHIADVSDLSNNILVEEDFEFQFIEIEEVAPKDILITEFLADPSPVVGLPENEFIELFNNSNNYIDLSKLIIKDNSTNFGQLPSYIFPPKTYVILCTESALDSYNTYGKCIVPNKWPSLNNGEDSIVLKTKENILIDGFSYAKSWIQNADKVDGGYSLEIINKDLACFDSSNWTASEAAQGGTPGHENSVTDIDFLGSTPKLMYVQVVSGVEIIFEFDKELVTRLDAPFEFVVNEVKEEVSYEVLQKRLVIRLNESLENGYLYNIVLKNIANCNGSLSDVINHSFIFDIQPPKLVDIFSMADTLLLLTFDEEVFWDMNLSNVFRLVDNDIEVEAIKKDKQEVLLSLNQALTADQPYIMEIDAVADEQDNLLAEEQIAFTYKPFAAPSFNDLIITELMIKPLGDNYLPNVEYIEIYNPHDYKVALVDFLLADSKDTTAIPVEVIMPGEHIILCPQSKSSQFMEFGRVIGLSPWPSLNNTADHISLFRRNSVEVNDISYTNSWYREDFKEEEGGWSLEIMDTNNPCAGKPNWRASISANRGTPGKSNSVREVYPDNFGPELMSVQAVDAQHLILTFSERIREDFIAPKIEIEPSKTILGISQLSNVQLQVSLEDTLKAKVLYTVSATNISDCVGNLNNTNRRITFALPEKAVPEDIVINEILYDPLPDGVDFIELYNRSDKYINLNGWRFQNQNDESEMLGHQSLIVHPYSFLVFTELPAQLRQQYATSTEPSALIAMELPSFPNHSGSISLIDPDLVTHQLLEYSDDMHSIFYHDTEGVSLERIHPESPIEVADSWHSAAANVGYATPGKVNSQFIGKGVLEETQQLTVEPSSFSPFRAGRSYTIISYLVHASAALATIKVFNTNGQEVKTLLNNQAIGTAGFVRWNGDDNNGNFVGVGYYIIHFSYFTPAGQVRELKQMVAVGAG